ncbi:MAG: hypothetical protein ACODAJ_10030 [Planctomycetota bacterium]
MALGHPGTGRHPRHGQPRGIGKVRGLKLHPGDGVRCTIEGIGTLENRAVREGA